MDLPHEKWQDRTLLEIASVVGTPLTLNGTTENMAFGQHARILVDMDFLKWIFDEIPVEREHYTFYVEVLYERSLVFVLTVIS